LNKSRVDRDHYRKRRSGESMHDLAARLAQGDEAAFAELYDSCADRLHHYVAMRLGSREAAADVVQAAFLRAVRSRRRFQGVENPVGYLFQIARNETARVAKQNLAEPMPLEHLPLSVGNGAPNDDAEVIAEALGRLAADDREIVELKVYGGLTFREIAEATGMPQGTVATRYQRALNSLRPWLAKQLR
jgi:RNA polymerase sigma-70 factor, ECF subfamily